MLLPILRHAMLCHAATRYDAILPFSMLFAIYAFRYAMPAHFRCCRHAATRAIFACLRHAMPPLYAAVFISPLPPPADTLLPATPLSLRHMMRLMAA